MKKVKLCLILSFLTLFNVSAQEKPVIMLFDLNHTASKLDIATRYGLNDSLKEIIRENLTCLNILSDDERLRLSVAQGLLLDYAQDQPVAEIMAKRYELDGYIAMKIEDVEEQTQATIYLHPRKNLVQEKSVLTESNPVNIREAIMKLLKEFCN